MEDSRDGYCEEMTARASNLFRLALCPGSARMEKGLPEEDSPQSREGKLLHDYYHHTEYDRGMLKPKQRDLVELADTLSSEVVERCEQGWHLFGQFVEIRETQLETMEHLSGTPDRLRHYYEDKAVVIVDPKFGFNTVERAELNLQLRAYAVIGFDYPDEDVSNVFVSIVQPRLAWEERITIANYTREDIELARGHLIAIVNQSEAKDAPLVAGEVQCRYCRAKLVCPAFREAFGDMALATVEEGKDFTVAKRAELIEKRLAEVSDEQIAALRRAVTLAGYIKTPLDEETRKRIAEGKLPEFKVAKDSEVRSIANVQRAISLLVLSKVSTKEKLMALADIPIGPIEEAYRETTGCTGKEAREKINKVLASVIEVETRKGRILKL